MSRIADALLKAGHRDLEGPEYSEGVALPWNLDEVHALMEEHQAPARPRGSMARLPRRDTSEFVELVQRVFGPAGGDSGARAVTFAAVGRAAGRRGVAIDVAFALARQGAGSVCVVDASSGPSALHAYAGVPAGPGLSDALAASAPAVSVAAPLGQQVWLVPAGEAADGAPMPGPAVVTRALSELAANFDFLIVQAPPLTDASSMGAMLTLAPATDGVVIVLDTERTRRDVAGEIVARLRANGVDILGAVVNA